MPHDAAPAHRAAQTELPPEAHLDLLVRDGDRVLYLGEHPPRGRGRDPAPVYAVAHSTGEPWVHLYQVARLRSGTEVMVLAMYPGSDLSRASAHLAGGSATGG